ncbi:MAG: hypothetical protein ABJA49_06855 [Betaproteobacteria bacterium]
MNRYLRYLIASTLLGTVTSVAADPGYYLVTAYDNTGQVNVDYRYWTVKAPGAVEVVWPEIGIGYGVNSRWYTAVLASYIGSANSPTQLSSLNWQNDFLLTQGQYLMDVALHTQLIRNRGRSESNVLEFGPVLQTDVGRTQLNANLIFERGLGNAPPAPTQLKYQWQAKYRFNQKFHLGLQGFGELGPWDHWLPGSAQSHRAGPMVSGTLPLGKGQAIRYDAAYLMGSVYGRNGNMFSLRLQYIF